ncbi:PQQ-dependent sugar dehydrogenase [Leptolyngbya sp. AN02str]|uniref:PQQ-dependent sugar dehydrogenase n=1 Tax=Leptolyngbya sp. AN02str TaxID=3423363 RepID=UPI003D3126AA
MNSNSHHAGVQIKHSAQRSIRLVGQFVALLAMTSCATATSVQPSATPDQAADSSTAAEPSPTTVAPENAVSSAIAAADVEVNQVTLAEGLEHPWGIVWLPDGNMLVTERPGRLRIIRNGVLDPNPIPGVPEVLAVGQGGLLDISLHPQFEQNGWVYFTYAAGSRSANHTRVARARFDGSALSDWTMLFEVNRLKQDGQHFGSRMTWLPDNTLLISIGDGGNPPVQLEGELIRNQAQDLTSRLGKIVRINDDGSIPADNPFADSTEADPAIWSYGHRNIQGLTIDPETNQVWSTEHGSRGGDELNLIQGGENYGWPVVTFSREYSGGQISAEQSRPGMVDPLVVWTPSKAPSGLTVYRGDRIPQWQGHLFSGGLVTRDVRRIELDASGNEIAQDSIDIGRRVRDVREGPDGYLYVLTDEPNGRLIRLEPVDSTQS